MDVLYHLGEATVAEVVERIPDRPGYNTIRNTMASLERKGYLRHRQVGQRYVYAPSDPVAQAQRSAVHHLLETFFDGSASKAVLAMLGTTDRRISREELDEIERYVVAAREARER